ncbi:unnamed protein product [Prorocentrum cordatum]|uniref:Uncharacterized protein n=1 Tax=Prorocentrum cordatum TaxID=2364126 RepID=A0ABN9XL19_9DINO|nr:unnamed protein product [Polarella glacialis]
MIYIFKGFGEICKLPCTLCKGCCDAFKEACSSCNTFWEPIIANPLGNYVIGTWVAMGFVCAAAIWGISQDLNCSSDLKGNIQLFCIANVVLACIHSGMSYYMQRQIIEKVGKPFAEMTAKEIQQKAGEILLYDVPVCLYSFLATAGYGLNAWALSLGSCGDSQPQSGSAFGAGGSRLGRARVRLPLLLVLLPVLPGRRSVEGQERRRRAARHGGRRHGVTHRTPPVQTVHGSRGSRARALSPRPERWGRTHHLRLSNGGTSGGGGAAPRLSRAAG